MANNLYKKLHIPEGKKGKVLLIASVSAVVILVALLLIFILRQANVLNPIAFKVGDTEVTKEEFDRYAELAKKYKVEKTAVKQYMITYHKYRIIADRYKIDIPDIFIENGKKLSTVKFAKTPSVLLSYSSDNNEYTKMMSYTYAFEQRVQNYQSGGYGFVMYDFPYDPIDYSKDPLYAMYVNNPDVSDMVKQNLGAYNAESVRKKTDELRAKLISSELNDQEALDVIKKDSYLSARSQSAATFMSIDGEVAATDKSFLTNGALAKEQIGSKLQSLKPGVSEVFNIPDVSFYFVDLKYKIDKDPEFLQKVKKDKDSIRVVEYDEQ